MGMIRSWYPYAAHDMTTWFSKRVDITDFTTLHVTYQVNQKGTWSWYGIQINPTENVVEMNNNGQPSGSIVLRRECAEASILHDVSGSGKTVDLAVHTWDIDVSSYSGLVYVGIFTAVGEFTTYRVWLE